MDNAALVLIAIALLMLVLILGTLTFLIYKLLKQSKDRETVSDGDRFHPAIMDRMKEARKIKRNPDLFCPNHPDEPGEVMCAICDILFCKVCIKPFKTLHFCRDHLPLVMNNNWLEVMTIKTSTEDPENGVRLFDAKKKLFEEESVPSYVETHYKINVDQDFIETYLVVFAQDKDLEKVRSSLNA